MQVAAKEALRNLSSSGIGNAGRLDHAAALCREHAKDAGEVRYLLVCESLEGIASDWKEYGAFPESLVTILEDILWNAIPEIIEASSLEGTDLADSMRRDIITAIRAWERSL